VDDLLGSREIDEAATVGTGWIALTNTSPKRNSFLHQASRVFVVPPSGGRHTGPPKGGTTNHHGESMQNLGKRVVFPALQNHSLALRACIAETHQISGPNLLFKYFSFTATIFSHQAHSLLCQNKID
jgi:hypothetical protein